MIPQNQNPIDMKEETFSEYGKTEAIRLLFEGSGFGFNDRTQFATLCIGHLFGVVEQGMVEIRGKDYRGSIYWTGKRAPAGFVATGLQKAFIHIWQKSCLFHSLKIFCSPGGSRENALK